MATVDVHVRIDKEVKEGTDNLLKQIGITISDFINMACRRAVAEQGLPFSTSVRELPENMRIETPEQLERFLEKRIREDDGTRYSSEEVLEMLGLRNGRVVA